jgi:hypothetical protein
MTEVVEVKDIVERAKGAREQLRNRQVTHS